MPRSPNKRPCTYPGCKAWARRDSDESLCAAHAHLATKELQPRPEGTPPGTPPASQPPRTHGGQPGNQNRLLHGFYRRTLHPEEVADLDEGAGATDLDGEILIARVALRRTLAMIHSGTTLGENPRALELDELFRLINLAFQGVRTVGRIVTLAHNLGLGDSLFAKEIDIALDELSAEWGIEL
jgi:hypothetical protein